MAHINASLRLYWFWSADENERSEVLGLLGVRAVTSHQVADPIRLVPSPVGIITPNCVLHAARLSQPIMGWFLLAVTLDELGGTFMREVLRHNMIANFGSLGRQAALPLSDLRDGSWLIRFVSRRAPRVTSPVGLEYFVQPAPGSILNVETELRPMRSHVGLIPIMTRIIVVQFVLQKRGTLG